MVGKKSFIRLVGFAEQDDLLRNLGVMRYAFGLIIDMISL